MGGYVLMIIEHDDSEILPHLYHRGGVRAYHEPDTLNNILAVARAHGCAPATKIVMRRAVWTCIFNESNHTICLEDVKDVEGIEVVIDDSIPMFPGFEIHREVW